MDVSSTGNGMADILKGIRFLRDNQVLVGIPQAESSRSDDGPNNVELAYIHSNGSELHRIPARPFLEPAMDKAETKNKVAELMGKAVAAALDGNEAAAMSTLNEAGMVGMNAVQDYILGSNLAGNAPITIEGGWMRNRKSGKAFYVEGKQSSRPLVDTGSLMCSITYVIEKR